MNRDAAFDATFDAAYKGDVMGRGPLAVQETRL